MSDYFRTSPASETEPSNLSGTVVPIADQNCLHTPLQNEEEPIASGKTPYLPLECPPTPPQNETEPAVELLYKMHQKSPEEFCQLVQHYYPCTRSGVELVHSFHGFLRCHEISKSQLLRDLNTLRYRRLYKYLSDTLFKCREEMVYDHH